MVSASNIFDEVFSCYRKLLKVNAEEGQISIITLKLAARRVSPDLP